MKGKYGENWEYIWEIWMMCPADGHLLLFVQQWRRRTRLENQAAFSFPDRRFVWKERLRSNYLPPDAEASCFGCRTSHCASATKLSLLLVVRRPPCCQKTRASAWNDLIQILIMYWQTDNQYTICAHAGRVHFSWRRCWRVIQGSVGSSASTRFQSPHGCLAAFCYQALLQIGSSVYFKFHAAVVVVCLESLFLWDDRFACACAEVMRSGSNTLKGASTAWRPIWEWTIYFQWKPTIFYGFRSW